MNAALNIRFGSNLALGTVNVPAGPTRAASYGKYVGRVGALAVALGVGFAVATGGGAGVAHADPDAASSESPSSASESDSSAESPADSPSDSSSDSDETDAEEPDAEGEASTGTDEGSDEPVVEEPAEEEPEAETETVLGDPVDTGSDTPPVSEDEPAATEPHDSDSSQESDTDGVVDPTEPSTEESVPEWEAVEEQGADADVEPSVSLPQQETPAQVEVSMPSAEPSSSEESAGADLVTTSVSALLAPFVSPPAPAPAPAPTLWAWLTVVTREIQRTWFNRRPDMKPNQIFSVSVDELGQPSQPLAFGGIDPDGDPLKYWVAPKNWFGPQHGSVNIDQATGTFTYTPDAAFAITGGRDTFLVRVTDLSMGTRSYGLASWLTGAYRDYEFVTVVVAPVSQAPVAGNDSFTGPEDTPVTGNVLTNDADPDSDDLQALLVKGPQHGTLTLNTNGSFVYTPNTDFNGVDTFTYRASDTTESDTATATISITAVNDAPTAPSASYGLNEDGVIEAALNGSDRDGDTLDYTVATGPAHGAVVVANGRFTYTASANYYGPDSFTYTVTDSAGGAATATIAISVAAVNDTPVAGADSYTVAEDDTLTVSGPGVLINDVDSDDDSLTAVLSVGPRNGSVSLNTNGSFVYTPDEDYYGTDSFTYTVTDPFGATATATVTITIDAVNDPPTPIGEPEVGQPDPATGVVSGSVRFSDTEGDVPTFGTPGTSTKGGTVTIDPETGEFIYTPSEEARHDAAADDAGPDDLVDTFTVTVDDGHGGTTEVLVSVTITPDNEDPTVGTPSIGAPDPATGVVSGSIPVGDADGDAPVFTVPGTSTKGGTVTIDPETGEFIYTPSEEARHDAAADDADPDDLVDTFTVTVDDGHGGTTDMVVSVTITPDNEDPKIGTPSIGAPDPATGVVSGSIPVGDADGDAPVFTVPGTSTKGGTVTIDPETGDFIYTPSEEARHDAAADDADPDDLVDTFTVTVDDGHGGTTDMVVSVTITPDNEGPTGTATVGSPNATTGVVSGTISADDADGDTPVITVPATSTQGGTISFDPVTGEFSYTPSDEARTAAAAGDATPDDLVDTFTVAIEDGHGGFTELLVSVAVAPNNAAPTGIANPGTPDAVTGEVTGTVTGTDPDGDTLEYSAPGASTKGGTVTIDPVTGEFVYTPTEEARHNAAADNAAADDLFDTFTVTIADGRGGIGEVVVSVAIGPNNAEPTAGEASIGEPDRATGTVTGTLPFTDADGDTLTYSGPITTPYGTVTIDPVTGQFTYTPNEAAREAAAAEGTTGGTIVLADPLAVTQGTFDGPLGGLYGLSQLGNAADGQGVRQFVATFFTADATQTYIFGQTSAPVDTVMILYVGAFDPNSPASNAVVLNDDTPVAVHAAAGAVVQNPSGCGSTSYCPQVSMDLTAGQTVTLVITTYAYGNQITLGLPQTFYTTGPGRFSTFSPVDTFSITADDGHGGVSSVSVSVPIAPANSAPTATVTSASPDPDTGVVDGTVIASDADDDAVTYSAPVTTAKGGTVTIDSTTGAFTYTPTEGVRHTAAADNAAPDDLVDTFTVTLTDGWGGSTEIVVSVNIGPANQAPIVHVSTVGTPDATTGVVTGIVTATDSDGDMPVITVPVTSTKGGTITFDSHTGEFTYTPSEEARSNAADGDATPDDLIDTFTVTIDDGHRGTTDVLVSVTVEPALDAPTSIGADPVITGNEDEALEIDVEGLLANDFDPDGPLTVTAVGGAIGGTVSLLNGIITFSPTANHNGPAEFTYTVTDTGAGTITPVTQTLTIAAINDIPTGTVSQDVPDPETGSVGGWIDGADVDGDGLTYSGPKTTEHGTVTIDPTTGEFTYTPNPDDTKPILDFGFETGTTAGWNTGSQAGSPLSGPISAPGHGVTVTNGTSTFSGGGTTWTYTAKGAHAGVLAPRNGSPTFQDAAAALGLTAAEAQAIVTTSGAAITNASWITKDVNLTAGETYTIAWNYLSTDYEPFNDGSVTSLVYTGAGPAPTISVNNYDARYALLGFTNIGTGDYSTGSYGSTGWQTATYQVSQTGTYRLGFVAFNLSDTALSPVLLIDDGPGTTLRNGQPFNPVPPNNPTVPDNSATSDSFDVTIDDGNGGITTVTVTVPLS
ncbi:Ig-like domain-containing protein [Mycolicibacterium iranicum]|uniref:Cadherin-like domain-containing protein n=1 Tax=Mycolicibacterium iranicum TaxID=912594 RepID=A0A178LUR6_MYCIR|nr:Ig-like domain-containing protein [Mycolicibacterium iranicum]OAN37968.1 hypothetical protein A4X20_20410 [Mycolicibacterium iranicum]